MKILKLVFLFSAFTAILSSCSQPSEEKVKNPMGFEETLVNNNAKLWWAKTVADITGDGLEDLVVIDNNGFGGWLGYLEADTTGGLWKKVVIKDSMGVGQKFAAGDLETGDFDGDGDIDVVGAIHPGEWQNADAAAEVYWFSNPTWESHYIGEVKNAIKDMSIADFNNDGKQDIAFITFQESNFRLYIQQEDGSFNRQQETTVNNLHEGMDAADIDGDGFIDLVANGYFFHNSGSDAEWAITSFDDRWHTQEGDWSRNGTKTAAKDIDGDGQAEVFMAHSERAGYPLIKYTYNGGAWDQEVLLDSLMAGHNMQLADMDEDGDIDVVTGVNRDRAFDLGEDETWPLMILINENGTFKEKIVDNKGSYNILIGDADGDGDMDLYRYQGHMDTTFRVHYNKVLK